jgi:hypothetical protein
LTRWLDPTVEVISAFSGTSDGAVLLVSFTEYDDVTHPESPLRYLFSGISTLAAGGSLRT